jgi:hypothetical protein
MPTFTIHESPDEQTAKVSAKGGRSLVRSFEVETSDPTTTDGRSIIEALGSQLGIYIGIGHPSWVWARCEDIDPGRPDRDDPRLWRARVTYSEPVAVPGTFSGGPTSPPPGPPPPPPPPGTAPTPASRPAAVSVSFKKQEVFDVVDLDGKRIANAAGDPLEDVPPSFRSMGAVHYTRWFEPSGWSYSTGMLLIGKVNLFTWEGFGVYTLLIDGIESQQKTERGFAFWEVKYTLLHNPKGWIPTELANVGRRAVRRGQPKLPVNIVPVIGTTTPVQLNSNGEQYDPALDVPPEPETLTFRFYSSMDFTGL